jgi:hypothetical protein
MEAASTGVLGARRIERAMTEPTKTPSGNGAGNQGESERHLEESIASVREALTGLRYGSVQLTVHEGRVVQIDVTEKRRLKPN